jgi:hypothetical protein
MQRQLRRGGGIMNIAPREKFGIGSSLKKFVRKVIPNEVAKVATVAAPFVAPFNPQLAAAMAGIGSFDQTGSIGDSLKRAGITYAGGQLARVAGGAGFQDPSMSLQGFTNLTSPTTGATIFGGFGGPKTSVEGIKAIDAGRTAAETAMDTRDLIQAGNVVPGADPGTFVSPLEYKQFTPSFSEGISAAVTESAPESVMKAIQNKDYGQAAKLAAEKGFNAVFKKPIRNDAGKIVGYDLDKNTLFAAGAFGLSYLDAKKVADAEGVDIGTEEEYDEATKAAKKEEYASYLTNFFEGKKDGGRIGYMFGDKVEDKEGIMSMSDEEDKNTKMAYFPGDVFSKAEISKLFRDKSLTTNEDRKQLFRILMNPGMFPEAEEMLKKMLRGKQDGGRIGFRNGSNRMMETFRMLEKAIADNDMDLAEELRTILRNEFSQKLAKGGRINYNMGSEVPVRKNKAGIEELDYRESGGFVPVGVKEKADDVPAMLSKNEFVLTADAVRGIGGGDVEKGAEKLYGVMKQAEKVGRA